MRPVPEGPEPRSPDEPRHPGTDAQEQDPGLGPGTGPDAESEASPDDTTPGGRP
jgi:hypothetical protein